MQMDITLDEGLHYYFILGGSGDPWLSKLLISIVGMCADANAFLLSVALFFLVCLGLSRNRREEISRSLFDQVWEDPRNIWHIETELKVDTIHN